MTSTDSRTVLRFEHVTAGYGATPVLADVSLSVQTGEVVAVMGPSGCGKSTMVRLAADLMPSLHGEVIWCAHHGREVAVMFQNLLLQPWLSVADNITLPARLKGQTVDADTLLRLVHLEGFGKRYPFQLSGGEQRRVALGRALAQFPRLLCLDEPFAGVDELTREELLILVSRVLFERSLSCLLVTHSPLESVFLADRVLVLAGRPTRVVGEIHVSLAHPRLVSAFDSTEFQAIVAEVRHMLRRQG